VVGGKLISTAEFEVVLDYSFFWLQTGSELMPDMAMIDEMRNGDGIAQRDGFVVVASPHQNNFAMKLLVEVWDSKPPSDLDAWQEAFEVHLDVDATNRLFYGSPPEGNEQELHVPPGAYLAIITGRGFVARGWPGSTTPGDSWRLRVWPSSGPPRPIRLRSWQSAAGTD
jgi:hypothetical protein